MVPYEIRAAHAVLAKFSVQGFLSLLLSAAGVDSSHHPLAGEPGPREHHASHAAETGGLPGLPPPAQAPQGPREVPTWDQFQHLADQAAAQQPASLHALRRENGLGEWGDHFYIPQTDLKIGTSFLPMEGQRMPTFLVRYAVGGTLQNINQGGHDRRG